MNLCTRADVQKMNLICIPVLPFVSDVGLVFLFVYVFLWQENKIGRCCSSLVQQSFRGKLCAKRTDKDGMINNLSFGFLLL